MIQKKIGIFVLGLGLSGIGYSASGGSSKDPASAIERVISAQEEVPVNRVYEEPPAGEYARWEEVLRIVDSSEEAKAEKVREVFESMTRPREVLKAIETREQKFLLHSAAEQGDLALVTVLVDYGSDIYALRQDSNKFSKKGKGKKTNYNRDSAFLNKSQLSDLGKVRGQTALHAALEAAKGDADAVAAFLVRQDRKGDTLWVREGTDRNLPIHMAAQLGRSEALKAMLIRDRRLVDQLNRTKKDGRRETPLFVATRGRPSDRELSPEQLECVRIIVAAGASIDYYYEDKDPRSDEVVRIVAVDESKGASMEAVRRYVQLRMQSHEKLLVNVRAKDLEKCHEALDEGAAFDGIYFRGGETIRQKTNSLHVAAKCNNLAYIEFLHREGLIRARDLEVRDSAGLRPLDYVFNHRRGAIHKIFARVHCPDLVSEDGSVAINTALEQGRVEALKFAFKNNSSLFIQALKSASKLEGQLPPLQKAIAIYSKIKNAWGDRRYVQEGFKKSLSDMEEVIDFLLENFYRTRPQFLNARSTVGQHDTALHQVCRLALPGMVKKLMRVPGIDATVRNGAEDTVLHVAMRRDSVLNLKIVAYLINSQGREQIQAKTKAKISPWKELQDEKDSDPDDALTIRNLLKHGRTKWGKSKKYDALMVQFRDVFPGFLN